MRGVRGVALWLLLLPLGGLLAGCDTLESFQLFDSKKKLPGERQPVFPNGVPGVTQGIPPEPAAAAAAATAEKIEPPKPQPKPKPKPKPRTAAAPQPAPQPQQQTAPQPAAQPAQSPWPSQPAQQGGWPQSR
jgi:outer membrane biosynthesis protein TonB